MFLKIQVIASTLVLEATLKFIMNSNKLVRKRNLKEKQTKDMNQKLKEEEMANNHIKRWMLYIVIYFNLLFLIQHYASKLYSSMAFCIATFILIAVIMFHWVSIPQFHSPSNTCSMPSIFIKLKNSSKLYVEWENKYLKE